MSSAGGSSAPRASLTAAAAAALAFASFGAMHALAQPLPEPGSAEPQPPGEARAAEGTAPETNAADAGAPAESSVPAAIPPVAAQSPAKNTAPPSTDPLAGQVLPTSGPSETLDAGADEQEMERLRAESKRRREAQYARNYFVLRLAPTRTGFELDDEVKEYWGGRVDGGFVIPFDDGAARMWWILFGAGIVPVEDGVLFSMPMSFAYGFRTPVVMGYLGGTFGLGGGGGKGESDLGPLYGGVAALGVSLNRVQLFFEGRYEGVILRAGQSYSQYSYGPVLSLVL